MMIQMIIEGIGLKIFLARHAALCNPIHMEAKNCDAILWPLQ